MIVIGLPGDEVHSAKFARVAKAWVGWLTGPLGFRPEDVRVLGGPADGGLPSQGPATREAVAQQVAALKQDVKKDDRLWVFWLGHANLDGDRAFLHLPGPDLRDDQFAELFRGVACREQVFWMTSACSGWFVKALSAPGRVVCAATARDQEITETEFPQALATIAGLPSLHLDADKDGKVSLLELFRSVTAEVVARFAADKRAPTEHAQLDDNGDGVGTESPGVVGAQTGKPPDGAWAARTFLSK